MLNSFWVLQKDSQQDVSHSSDLDQKKKWHSTHVDRQRGEWDKVAELMKIEFGESGHPVFRATSPLSRGVLKRKKGGNYQDTLVPMEND